MRSVAKVESRRELLVEGKVEEETRYYISSLPGDAKQIHAVHSPYQLISIAIWTACASIDCPAHPRPPSRRSSSLYSR